MKDEIKFQLAGGVSTLEDGFSVGWISDEKIPVLCLAINKKGEVFAKFLRDKRIIKSRDCSRAELEAVQGRL